MKKYFFISLLLILINCSKDEDNNSDNPNYVDGSMYFPPINSTEWESISPASLSWNTQYLDDLYNYLSENGTRAFIVLKNGRIVIEQYWGKDILNLGAYHSNSQWYWASAGKAISAVLIGIAQHEGLLNINNKTSDFLGVGWTTMPTEKEDLITVRHQLTMTTGLDYEVDDLYCIEPECLQYKADAGTQWFYHNAPYTLLKDVLSAASGMNYNDYSSQKLETRIGMSGEWYFDGINNVYWSTARDMARFGLLILNSGRWNDEQVIEDTLYFNEMINTSQDLNLSYGYLWWLNGKGSIIYPGLSFPLNIDLSSNAPTDLITGAGKNGQFVEVIPSENIVVIRMGEAPDGASVPILFHNEMWKMISKVIE